MSNAEIVAYMFGVSTRDAFDQVESGGITFEAFYHATEPPEVLTAWDRLGDQRFTYWMDRGAEDWAKEHSQGKGG